MGNAEHYYLHYVVSSWKQFNPSAPVDTVIPPFTTIKPHLSAKSWYFYHDNRPPWAKIVVNDL